MQANPTPKALRASEHQAAEPWYGFLLRGGLAVGAVLVPGWLVLAVVVRASDPLALPRLLGYPESAFTVTVQTLEHGVWVETTAYTLSGVLLAICAATYALPPSLGLGLAFLVMGLGYRWLMHWAETRSAQTRRRAWDRALKDDAVLDDSSWTHDLPEPPG